MARKYTAVQIIGFILSLFLPPVAVWFTEGFGIDFWIDVVLCFFGWIPGSIHSIYVYLVWLERKWKTRHGEEVTTHPFLVFSKEFEQRSRWKGNGQEGFFGYFDDDIKGGSGKENTVGGVVDPEQARPIPHHHQQEAAVEGQPIGAQPVNNVQQPINGQASGTTAKEPGQMV